ncbi:MAG: hypothetical protein HYZ79_02715 [Candidatus Melainabacteria bacterium]|nr:hypothetical protein [Candidatus Melainabacteria bacterium]
MTSEAADRTKPMDPERVMFDLAMNVANQGGFIYVGEDGKARKWEIKGSGARAFNDLFHALYAKGLLPGLPNSKITGPQDVDKLIGPELIQVNGEAAPFTNDRLAVFKEFASSNAWAKIASIVDYARQDENNFTFDFKSVRDIASAFPISFGQDPLYKKAALLPILFANNANTRGKNVTVSGIVAADYRLPQTLHSIGVLDFSPELVQRIENEEVMSPDDLMVVQMRAASIYACDLLSKYTGMQINEVDAAFWKAMKDGSLQPLQEEAVLEAQRQGRKITLKQMLVPTFSFAKIPPIFYPTVAAGAAAAARAMLNIV